VRKVTYHQLGEVGLGVGIDGKEWARTCQQICHVIRDVGSETTYRIPGT